MQYSFVKVSNLFFFQFLLFSITTSRETSVAMYLHAALIVFIPSEHSVFMRAQFSSPLLHDSSKVAGQAYDFEMPKGHTACLFVRRGGVKVEGHAVQEQGKRQVE
jgi:redox-sensitive bicupin YhaK (pirin superfamily)